ncbi:MAG: hypothetical protein WBF22_00520, partial [Methylocella sp.]
PYGILARIDSASPIMLGPCDEWRNLTLTGGSNPDFYNFNAPLERAFLIGTRSANSIKASGHRRRTQGPDI